MESVDQLQEEHRVIEKVIPMVERVAATFVGGDQVVEFLQVFLDKCHHGKEELYLFPALAERGVSRQEGLIRELLVEHGLGRRYVKEIAGLLHPATTDENENSRQLLEAVVPELVQLLRDHIAKEDKRLWPLARRVLTAEDDASLLAGFAEMEKHLIGEQQYRKYLSWARLWS